MNEVERSGFMLLYHEKHECDIENLLLYIKMKENIDFRDTFKHHLTLPRSRPIENLHFILTIPELEIC
jgi:hypothetical protein